MSLNCLELSKIVKELNSLIKSSLIEKVSEIEKSFFIFKLYQKEEYHLLINLNKQVMRLHLTKRRWKAQKTPSAFLAYLRKYVQGGVVEEIKVLNQDRLVEITVHNNDQTFYLIIEMIQGREDILVLDSDRNVFYTLNPQKHNDLLHKPYQPPESRNYTAPLTIPEDPDKLYNQSVEEHYDKLLEELGYQKTLSKLISGLKRDFKHSEKAFNNLMKQEKDCDKWEEWQQKGELLKSQFYKVKKGDETIVLQNYFDPLLSEIPIRLDPLKSPSDNVSAYFKRAKKLKTGLKHVSEKLHTARLHCDRLTKLYTTAQDISNPDDLKEYLHANKDEKEIKRAISEKVKSQKENKAPSLPYQQYYSAKEKVIHVGKTSRDNDRLTFSVAKGNDLWFHVRDYPGSHVVVPLRKDEVLDQESLLDAANLSLNYSKAKNHQEGEVMYTRRKYLSKRKNAPPGEVQVSEYKSIFIRLDTVRLKEIKERSKLLNDR